MSAAPESIQDKISPEDLARVMRVNAKLAQTTERFQRLQDEVSKARDEVVGARAILMDISEEISGKYGIKDGDTLDAEGTIIRKVG